MRSSLLYDHLYAALVLSLGERYPALPQKVLHRRLDPRSLLTPGAQSSSSHYFQSFSYLLCRFLS